MSIIERMSMKSASKRRSHRRARLVRSAESPMFVGLSKIPKVEDRRKAVNRLILGAK